MSDRCPPILGQWEDRLVAQQARARSVVEGLAPERLVTPPEEGKWSVAHCLDHLATTIEAFATHSEFCRRVHEDLQNQERRFSVGYRETYWHQHGRPRPSQRTHPQNHAVCWPDSTRTRSTGTYEEGRPLR